MKSGRIIYALAQLSGRERLLLTLLGVIGVPVAVIFLAILPMTQSRDAARVQAKESSAMLEWVTAQVRALPAEQTDMAAEPGIGRAPIGISDIEESLVRGALRDQVSQLSNRPDGGVDLSLEAARFDLLGDWLQEMTPAWGYRIAAFRIEAAGPGMVNATFELEAAQ